MVQHEKVYDFVKEGYFNVNIFFKGVIVIRGKIKTETGLLIGSLAEEIEIGKVDQFVVRDPITRKPYVPGSSLKGRMRCLLEYKYEKVSSSEVHSCADPSCEICRIFGSKENIIYGPTRIGIFDAILTEESRKELESKGLGNYVEMKVENYINRVTGRAEAPRVFERVPAGVFFDLTINYNVFDVKISKTDEEPEKGSEKYEKYAEIVNSLDKINEVLSMRVDVEYLKHVFEGLSIIEDVGIGSSVSRGYGRVKFIIEEIEVRPLSYYQSKGDAIRIDLEKIIGPPVEEKFGYKGWRPIDILRNFDKIKQEIINALSSE